MLTAQHMFERLWMFLTESLLALTIFRYVPSPRELQDDRLIGSDDFSASFAITYGVLVFLKCFHWITADRVDYVSLSSNSIKISSLLGLR